MRRLLTTFAVAVTATACTSTPPAATPDTSEPAAATTTTGERPARRLADRSAGPIEVETLTGAWTDTECATAITLLPGDADDYTADTFVQNRRWVTALLAGRIPWPVRTAAGDYLAALDRYALDAETGGWDRIEVDADPADRLLVDWVQAAARVRCLDEPHTRPGDYLTYAGAGILDPDERACAARQIGAGPARWWDGPWAYTSVEGCGTGPTVETLALAAAIVANDANDPGGYQWKPGGADQPIVDDPATRNAGASGHAWWS